MSTPSFTNQYVFNTDDISNRSLSSLLSFLIDQETQWTFNEACWVKDGSRAQRGKMFAYPNGLYL